MKGEEDMKVLMMIDLAVTGVLVLLGFLFRAGKGAFLIAGYNTMSPAEKAKYDEKKLCRLMGNFMFVLALLWTLIMISHALENAILHTVALVLFFAVTLAGAIFLDKRAKK